GGADHNSADYRSHPEGVEDELARGREQATGRESAADDHQEHGKGAGERRHPVADTKQEQRSRAGSESNASHGPAGGGQADRPAADDSPDAERDEAKADRDSAHWEVSAEGS